MSVKGYIVAIDNKKIFQFENLNRLIFHPENNNKMLNLKQKSLFDSLYEVVKFINKESIEPNQNELIEYLLNNKENLRIGNGEAFDGLMDESLIFAEKYPSERFVFMTEDLYFDHIFLNKEYVVVNS